MNCFRFHQLSLQINLFSRAEGHQTTEFCLLAIFINNTTTITKISPKIILFSNFFAKQERKEGGKRGRKPGRKASAEKIDMKAKLGMFLRTISNCVD